MVEAMTESDQTVAVHLNPVWRDRSNFIIRAALPDNTAWRTTEQLWARRLSDHSFEICCIPFFIYGVSLGDVVSTSSDGSFELTEVTAPSSRSTYRAWFGESTYSQEAFVSEVAELGGLVERSSENLLAIDASNAASASTLTKYLTRLHDRGDLVFEVGASR
jgi:hypothetical protein